jgi:hypothetical protein
MNIVGYDDGTNGTAMLIGIYQGGGLPGTEVKKF